MNLLNNFKKIHNNVNNLVIKSKEGATMLQALGVSIAVSIISITVSTIVLNSTLAVERDLLSSPASTEARASVDQSVYEVEKYMNDIDISSYSARDINEMFERDILPTIVNDYGVTAIDVSDLYNGSGTNTTNSGDYSLAYRIGKGSGNNMIYRDILISSSSSGDTDSSDTIGVPGDILNPDYISADIYSSNQLMLAGGVYLEGDIDTRKYYQTAYPMKYYEDYHMPDSLFEQYLANYNFPLITSNSTLKVANTSNSLYMCNTAGKYYNWYSSGCFDYEHGKQDLYGEKYIQTMILNQNSTSGGFTTMMTPNSGNAAYYIDQNNSGGDFDTIAASNIKKSNPTSYNFDGEEYALEVLGQAMNGYSGDDLTFDNAYDMTLEYGFDEITKLSSLNSNGKVKNSFSYKGKASDLNKDGYIELEYGMDFSNVDNVAYLDGNGYPVKLTVAKDKQKYGGILVVNGDLTIDVKALPMYMDLYFVVNGNVTISNSKDSMYLTNTADLPLYIIASGNIEFSSFNRNSNIYSSDYFRQTAGSNFKFQLHAYLIAGGSITCETLTSDFISLVGGMYAFGNQPSTSYNDLYGIILTSYRKLSEGGQSKDPVNNRFIFHSIDYEHERNYLPTFMYEKIGIIDGNTGTSNFFVTDFQTSSKSNFNG